MIGLTVTYIVIVTLLLWFLIGAKGMWSLKFVAIAATLYLGLFINVFIKDHLGFSVEKALPNKFEVYQVLVDEPTSIFFFINDKEPRLYKVPYTKPMHNVANGVQGLLKQGKRVMIDMEGEGGDGQEGEGGQKGKKGNSKGQKGNRGESWKGHDDPIYYELPIFPRTPKENSVDT